MCGMKCGNVMKNSLTAKMPEPPKAIEGLLDEYQDFWGSVFAREYECNKTNPAGTLPSYMPQLSKEEKHYIETLTRRLHDTPEWREYTKQCRQWAVMM